jgi:transcriptional regulator with XRE-family HTH domain
VPPSPRKIDKALEAYGRGVRDRRQKLDLNQYEAARRAGISQSNWSKIERAEIRPSVEQMLRIHAALEAESLDGYFGRLPAARHVG